MLCIIFPVARKVRAEDPLRLLDLGIVHHLYEEFTRLAETRLGQNTINYLSIA